MPSMFGHMKTPLSYFGTIISHESDTNIHTYMYFVNISKYVKFPLP